LPSAPRSGFAAGVLSDKDRRRYRRVRAPVLCRPLGKPLFRRAQPIDVSEGGLRIYADEPMSVADRLEIELFLPDGSSIECNVEIVWVEALAGAAPARFDVGLRFLDPSRSLLERLAAVLDRGTPLPR
jgi:hypothetical protein